MVCIGRARALAPRALLRRPSALPLRRPLVDRVAWRPRTSAPYSAPTVQDAPPPGLVASVALNAALGVRTKTVALGVGATTALVGAVGVAGSSAAGHQEVALKVP